MKNLLWTISHSILDDNNDYFFQVGRKNCERKEREKGEEWWS